MEKAAVCLTFGEQSENHAGMEINGEGLADSGFTVGELRAIKLKLEEKEIHSELHILNRALANPEDATEAGVLFIKNGVQNLIGEDAKKMYKEQLQFDWDRKYWDNRRQKVLNKRARFNVCYGEESIEPDYENKRGTIVGFDKVPTLKKLKDNLSVFFGEKASDLEVEGNLYYDVSKCGIGFHGDSERKRVIACSLGAKRPIHWQWYQNSKPIGERIKFELDGGDMYIMSEKATGFDWKKRSQKTLRHAAGVKYVS